MTCYFCGFLVFDDRVRLKFRELTQDATVRTWTEACHQECLDMARDTLHRSDLSKFLLPDLTSGK